MRRRAHHPGRVAADRRVRPDRRERPRLEERRGHRRRLEAGRRRPVEHGVHELPRHARERRDDRHRDGRRHRGREHLRHAQVDADAEDAAERAARHVDAVDRGSRGPDDRDHVRPRRLARRLDQGHLHDGHRAGARCRADGDAHRPAGHPLERVDDARRRGRRREEPRLRRDARLDLGDQLGQDGHAHPEPGHRRRGDRPDRPLRDLRDGLRPRGRRQARRRQHQHDRAGDPAVPRLQRRQARRRQGRRRSHRGRAARARPQGEARHRGHPGRLPAARDPAVRSHLQAHGRLRGRQGRIRERGRAGVRQGSRAGGDRARVVGARERRDRSLGRRAERPRDGGDGAPRRQGAAHHGRGDPRHRSRRTSIPRATCSRW